MSLKKYLKLLKPPSKIMPTINYAIMVFYGAIITNSFNLIIPLLLTVFSTIFAWIFSVGINDYYDFNIDSISNPGRPLITGDLTKKNVRNFFTFSASISLALAFISSILTTIWQSIFIIIFILLGILYSAPPIRIKMRTSLSTFVIGITCCTSILAGGLLNLGKNDLPNIFNLDSPNYFELIFISVFIGLIAFIASIVKDFKDIPGDKAAGIPTLPIRYGAQTAAKIMLFAGIIIYSCFFFFPYFNNVYFYAYPFIIFALISWCLIHIYYIKDPGKKRAEVVYKFGFMGFLVIIISFIFLLLFIS
ncbi:MAG: UbiA prenyltransferase family protein [Candidatus Helarchaeota archaeon]